jgi:broad-specificity NMP kinase
MYFNGVNFAIANQITEKVIDATHYSVQRIIDPIKLSLKKAVEENVCNFFEVSGHYDTYISKSCVSVLENKYLSKKYGSTLMDVDPSFALCSASIERVKKKVSCFPELVNKTIAPGLYSLRMDKDGTRMIVVKEPILNDDDRSSNGISGVVMNFSTKMFFVGPHREKWYNKVRKEIDDLVSEVSKSSQGNNRLRYQSISSAGEASNDLRIRPMNFLTFPAKEELLAQISDFVAKEAIYKEFSVPYRLGILLSGKPGTGKTAFAFSLAQHLDMNCVSVNLDYFDKEEGDNQFNKPNTVFVIDEIDSQLINRAETSQKEITNALTHSRRLLQLLRAMDTMDNCAIVVATTNYPEKLDPALRRSGRFDICIDMDDLSEEYAKVMVENRGGDPKEVLKGITFPVNPAELEQIIIQNVLEKNNMLKKNVASYEELGLQEEEKPEEVKESDDDGTVTLKRNSLDSFIGTAEPRKFNYAPASYFDEDKDDDEDENEWEIDDEDDDDDDM